MRQKKEKALLAQYQNDSWIVYAILLIREKIPNRDQLLYMVV